VFLRSTACQLQNAGDGLIAGYHERLKKGGGGISPRRFIEGVVLPTLSRLGIGRSELKSADVQERTTAEMALPAEN